MPAVTSPFGAPSLGTGLSYPMRLDATGGRPIVVSDYDLVKASIEQILLTDITERPFVTRNGIPFGTRIRRSLFTPVDVAAGVIKYEAKRALDLWEPRISVRSVQVDKVDTGNGYKLVVSISAVWSSTNSPTNFVVAFPTGGKS